MLSIPPYLALAIAIGLEVFATSWLPKTQQFTAVVPTLAVLVGYGLAFYLLAVAVQTFRWGSPTRSGVVLGLFWWRVFHGWFMARTRYLRDCRDRFYPRWDDDHQCLLIFG